MSSIALFLHRIDTQDENLSRFLEEVNSVDFERAFATWFISQHNSTGPLNSLGRETAGAHAHDTIVREPNSTPTFPPIITTDLVVAYLLAQEAAAIIATNVSRAQAVSAQEMRSVRFDFPQAQLLRCWRLSYWLSQKKHQPKLQISSGGFNTQSSSATAPAIGSNQGNKRMKLSRKNADKVVVVLYLVLSVQLDFSTHIACVLKRLYLDSKQQVLDVAHLGRLDTLHGSHLPLSFITRLLPHSRTWAHSLLPLRALPASYAFVSPTCSAQTLLCIRSLGANDSHSWQFEKEGTVALVDAHGVVTVVYFTSSSVAPMLQTTTTIGGGEDISLQRLIAAVVPSGAHAFATLRLQTLVQTAHQTPSASPINTSPFVTLQTLSLQCLNTFQEVSPQENSSKQSLLHQHLQIALDHLLAHYRWSSATTISLVQLRSLLLTFRALMLMVMVPMTPVLQVKRVWFTQHDLRLLSVRTSNRPPRDSQAATNGHQHHNGATAATAVVIEEDEAINNSAKAIEKQEDVEKKQMPEWVGSISLSYVVESLNETHDSTATTSHNGNQNGSQNGNGNSNGNGNGNQNGNGNTSAAAGTSSAVSKPMLKSSRILSYLVATLPLPYAACIDSHEDSPLPKLSCTELRLHKTLTLRVDEINLVNVADFYNNPFEE